MWSSDICGYLQLFWVYVLPFLTHCGDHGDVLIDARAYGQVGPWLKSALKSRIYTTCSKGVVLQLRALAAVQNLILT